MVIRCGEEIKVVPEDNKEDGCAAKSVKFRDAAGCGAVGRWGFSGRTDGRFEGYRSCHLLVWRFFPGAFTLPSKFPGSSINAWIKGQGVKRNVVPEESLARMRRSG